MKMPWFIKSVLLCFVTENDGNANSVQECEQ